MKARYATPLVAAVSLTAVASLFVAGCPKKPEPTPTPTPVATTPPPTPTPTETPTPTPIPTATPEPTPTPHVEGTTRRHHRHH